MSTRCLICKEMPDGIYKHIYCHNKGMPYHSGCILNKYYNTSDKVDKLLALGELSEIDIRIDKDKDRPHDKSYKQYGVCLAYRRDLKEKSKPALENDFVGLLNIARNAWIEYVYIFSQEGKWTVASSLDIENPNIKEKNKSRIFKDLNSEIEKSIAVEDRYNLTPERADLLNQINYKVEDEMDKLMEACDFLEPLNVFDKADSISSICAVKDFINLNCERFTNKEIKTMLPQRYLLETIAQNGAFTKNQLHDMSRHAVYNFFEKCFEKEDEDEHY